MDLQFQHPGFFIALLAVPFVGLLFWYLLTWKKTIAKKIGDEKLVKELTKSHSPRKFIIKFSLVTIALVAIIIAIVNPLHPGSMDKVERKGVDVMIALDVSNSMLAEDIKPNRLEKAKQLVYRLLNDLQDDRVGLVLFAGRAYMQMPLTTDHAAARMYVQNASPQIVPTQGTMISEALKLCGSAFNSKERKYKSIILITDGEDHDPATMEVAEQLTANGVMVNTVGVGSALGTPIPNSLTGQFKKDDQGNTILSKLNEGQLQQLAAATKGIYVNNENVNAASSAIMKKLSAISETVLEDAAFKDYIHFFPWFIALAIILLLGEFLLPERKYGVAILLLICSSANAQNVNTRNGNKFYKEGKYDKAIAEYKKAASANNSNVVSKYNLGNAYYRSGQYGESADTYQQLLGETKDQSVKQKTYYNKGVSLSKQNKLEESIEAYKNAVKMNPADEDARINLQKALLELKKKQPPKKENEENKKKEQKKQQKKDQQKQPPPSNLSKKEVERLLKALQQREQQVQQKMQQSRARSAGKQEKDW